MNKWEAAKIIMNFENSNAPTPENMEFLTSALSKEDIVWGYSCIIASLALLDPTLADMLHNEMVAITLDDIFTVMMEVTGEQE